MMILCTACNSKYLVNSADLKPSGRDVQCAKCGFYWFQKPDLVKEENQDIKKEIENNTFLKNDSKTDEDKKNADLKLPSTYVKEKEPSTFNSIVLIVFIIFMFFLFWIIRNQDFSFLELIKFYIFEFYFNLKLIINDIATLTYKLFN